NAGAENGGGILAAGGSLTLNSSILLANSATNGGGLAVAGGAVSVNFTTIGPDSVGSSSNSASSSGGGVFLASGNAATIRNRTISGNQAQAGGGVFVSGGATITLNNTTIPPNPANGPAVTDGGGGLFAAGTANLNSVTVAANNVSGSGSGGGLLQLGGT